MSENRWANIAFNFFFEQEELVLWDYFIRCSRCSAQVCNEHVIQKISLNQCLTHPNLNLTLNKSILLLLLYEIPLYKGYCTPVQCSYRLNICIFIIRTLCSRTVAVSINNMRALCMPYASYYLNVNKLFGRHWRCTIKKT